MTNADVEILHNAFVQLTGRDIPLDLAGFRASQWFEWNRHGFTEDDLRLVVAYVRNGIKSGRRNEGALKFVNMIGDPIKFGDDLAEAKAQARKPKIDYGRQEVLRATKRTTPTTYHVTPAGQAAFEALKKLGEQL